MSQDIFTLFITYIIPSLADPTSPYNPQHQHVLQSLASVKSIILVSDLPSSQSLIVRLFSTCFDGLESVSNFSNVIEIECSSKVCMVSTYSSSTGCSCSLRLNIEDETEMVSCRLLKRDGSGCATKILSPQLND